MICPSEDTLLATELGELPHNKTLELAEHEAHCSRCRQVQRQHRALFADLGAAPTFARSETDFTAAVLARCTAANTAAPGGSSARLRAPLYGALVLAAGVCLWLLRPAAPVEHFAARGGSHSALEPVSVEARLVRDGKLLPLDGAELHAGDGITARYFNRGERARYLALFALDAAGSVHWIFPAYLDPASNPSSLALAPSPEGHLLEDTVEPETPASGPLRVVAVVSDAPLSVREIEQRLAGEGRSMQQIFSPSHVQEWSATWTAR
ncbi:MAG TPA: hypothetical protein VGI10_23185 [Polyangiaceae bacterium]|jgi:hypothetical protein